MKFLKSKILVFSILSIALLGSAIVFGAYATTPNSSAAGSAGYDVPFDTYYQQVQYIEFTGTQYIDTGIYPNQDTTIEIDIMLTSIETGTLVESNGIYLTWSTIMAYGFGSDEGAIDFPLRAGETYEFGMGYDIGGIYFSSYNFQLDYNTFTSSNTLAIGTRFANNNALYAQINTGRIYDNGTLVRNFTPCYRKVDGVAGLWDSVNQVFYPNAASGADFITGPHVNSSEYKGLEYLAGYGYIKVDTGIVPNATQEYEIKFSLNDVTTEQVLFGSVTSGTNAMTSDGSVDSVKLVATADSKLIAYHSTLETVLLESLEVGKIYTVKVPRNPLAIFTGDATQPIYLCALNNNGTAKNYASMNLYNFKVWDNGALIRDFVPSGSELAGNLAGPKGGLMDVINGDFFELSSSVININVIPAGYQQVECLEFSGSQYIDTGYKPNQDTSVIMGVEFTSSSASGPLYSSMKSLTESAYHCEVGNGSVRFCYSATSTNSCSNEFYPSINTVYEIFSRKNEFYAGGTNYTTGSTLDGLDVTFQSTATMTIGAAFYGYSYVDSLLKDTRIYSCRILDNDIVVRDFVPCYRKTDGVAGLYDTIEGKFYANANTSSTTDFGYGDLVGTTSDFAQNYVEVDYIESSGTQWIDTKYNAKPTTRIRADYQFVKTNPQSRIWSTYETKYGNPDAFNVVAYINGSGNFAYSYTDGEGYWKNTEITADTNRHIFDMDGVNKTYYISDVGTFDLVQDGYTASETSTKSVYLFSNGSSVAQTDGNYSHATARMYGCQIWDNGILVRDFIPCYRKSDGVVGLYDNVNKVFYTNANSSSVSDFKAAGGTIADSNYQQVEYIESTGTQYIDTGLLPTDTQKYNIKYSISDTSISQVLFGSRTSGNWETSTNQMYYYAQNTTQFSFYLGTRSQAWQGITADAVYESGLDTSYFAGDNFDASTATKTVYIFALNDATSVNNFAKMKLYDLKIYDNGVLIRNYIPCYRVSDGEAGLYDTVTKTFFENKGTGSFNYGG